MTTHSVIEWPLQCYVTMLIMMVLVAQSWWARKPKVSRVCTRTQRSEHHLALNKSDAFR